MPNRPPEDNGDDSSEYARSRGFMPSAPDPTKLTTDAVRQSVEVSRREIGALRETIETRLAGDDSDRARLWERVRDLPQLYETAASHLRNELVQRDEHDREVLTQRLNDLDTATRLANEQLSHTTADNDAQSAVLARGFSESLRSEREYLLAQIALVGERHTALSTRFDAVNGDVQSDRDRAISALRQIIDTRLDAIDRATELRLEAVKTLPSETRAEIEHLRTLHEERFSSIAQQFQERDVRTDQNQRASDQALNAALQAAKELVNAQGEASSAAAVKSETSFTKQIDQIGTIISTLEKALDARITELKERIDRGEGQSAGVYTAHTENRASRGENHNTLVLAVMAISTLVAIISFIAYATKKLQAGISCGRGRVTRLPLA